MYTTRHYKWVRTVIEELLESHIEDLRLLSEKKILNQYLIFVVYVSYFMVVLQWRGKNLRRYAAHRST